MDETAIIVALIWCVGGFINGVTAIGGAMLCMPFTAMFMPIKSAIALACLCGFIIEGIVGLMHIRNLKLHVLLQMWLGVIPGCLLGLCVLKFFSADALRLIVGFSLFAFLAWLQYGKNIRARGESPILSCGTGFASALFGTSISFGGPPVAAYSLYAGWEPREFLGTQGLFASSRAFFTCVTQYWAGFYTPELIHYICYVIPLVILGTVAAYPVSGRLKKGKFNFILKIVLAISALICICGVFFHN